MFSAKSLNSPAVVATVLGGAGQGLLALLGLVGVAHGVASTPEFANTCAVFALGLTVVGLGLTPCPACVGDACAVDNAMLLGWPQGRLTRMMRFIVLGALVVGMLYVQEWSGSGGAPHLVTPLGLASFALGLGLLILTGLAFAGRHRVTDAAQMVSAGLLSGLALLMAVSAVFQRNPWFQVMLAALFLAAFAGLSWRRWRGSTPPFDQQRQRVFGLAGVAAVLLALWFVTPWVSLVLAPVVLVMVWLERGLFLSRAVV